MNKQFPSGDRTYYVSDERLKAFKQLTPEQRLKWVEKMATFMRLAKLGGAKPDEVDRISLNSEVLKIDGLIKLCRNQNLLIDLSNRQP